MQRSVGQRSQKLGGGKLVGRAVDGHSIALSRRARPAWCVPALTPSWGRKAPGEWVNPFEIRAVPGRLYLHSLRIYLDVLIPLKSGLSRDGFTRMGSQV